MYAHLQYCTWLHRFMLLTCFYLRYCCHMNWLLYPNKASVQIKALLAGGGYGSIGVASVNPTYQFFLTASSTITAANYLAQIQNTNPMNLYPFTTVLPVNGLVMIISGVQTRFYTYAYGFSHPHL